MGSSPAAALKGDEPTTACKFWTCLGKVVFAPVILLAQSLWIFFFGCIGTYCWRLGRGLACGVCICCNCTFKDKKFPPNFKSIGEWKGMTPQQVDKAIKWRRISDICAGKEDTKLFGKSIEPRSICQGSLGDCWLMSALGCLANQEGTIQQVFLTNEYTAYGRYRIRLYDTPRERWVTVAVDDWIPCDAATGKPVFARPKGDEAWVLLLEKAMAKFKGSYAALDGGSTLWALETLTGDYVFKFKADPRINKWVRSDIVHKKNTKGRYDVYLSPSSDILDSEKLFETMLWYNRKRSVIGASTGEGNDTQSINGIVLGHAYAVIDVQQVEGLKMLQLRNPWGTFEWQGNWSDRSPLWKQHPKVAKELKFDGAVDDGSFWMEWKDFVTYYKNIDFCSLTTGWDNLQLDIHEHNLWCGPTLGCIKGCATFWCCCKGCRALFCARRVRKFERPPEGCCACACIQSC